MLKPFIIGIVGKAGSGKNTLALHIQDCFELPVAIQEISEVAKNQARLLYRWNGIKDEAGRQLLQDIMEAGNKYNPDLWTTLLGELVDSLNARVVIVPDIRPQNQAEWIRARGGVVVGIIRPDSVGQGITEITGKHKSELAVDVTLKSKAVNVIFTNDGNEDKLKAFAQVVAESVKSLDSSLRV
jgi:ABC-type dipeptide/oligopeptide/nickel transport system ATPase component